MNLKEQWIGLQTILRRELERLFRIWIQTILPPIITTTLYFMIFGQVIGARIGQMNGVNYIDFISPGLIMMSMITGAYSGTVGSFFGMKFGRNIEEMQVSPLPNYLIVLGFMLGGVLRGLVIGIEVSFIAFLFTGIHVHSLLAIVIVTLLSTSIFSLAGMINAVYAKKFDDIALIPTFILTPMTYLGGVFYSITVLSPFWQKVSLFNPVIYIIGTFRFGFLGTHSHFMAASFVVMVALTIGLYCICLRLMNKGIGLRN